MAEPGLPEDSQEPWRLNSNRMEHWDEERTQRECAERGHPWYGDEHSGAPGPTGRCLCGEVRY